MKKLSFRAIRFIKDWASFYGVNGTAIIVLGMALIVIILLLTGK